MTNLPRLAWPTVILPESCSLQRRKPRRDMAWMLPSILTSFFWFSWKAARGTPNCFLSPRYLISNTLQQKWAYSNTIDGGGKKDKWRCTFGMRRRPLLRCQCWPSQPWRDCTHTRISPWFDLSAQLSCVLSGRTKVYAGNAYEAIFIHYVNEILKGVAAW